MQADSDWVLKEAVMEGGGRLVQGGDEDRGAQAPPVDHLGSEARQKPGNGVCLWRSQDGRTKMFIFVSIE